MGPTTSKRLMTKLNTGAQGFYDNFFYAFLHRIPSETISKCEETCSKVYWGSNCCAKINMGTELYENGVAIFDSSDNFYCMKKNVVAANPSSTFKDVDFTMSCSGAVFLSVAMASFTAFTSFIY